MIGQAPICLQCKHYIKDPHRLICDAFPNQIPDDIVDSIFIHTEPYLGDHGIQFEERGPNDSQNS
jgi:hypothetical protein